MKKIAIFCILALLVFCRLPVYAVDAGENSSISAGCNTLDGQVPLMGSSQLLTNAKSMLLYELTTDTLMYAYNADEKISPASFFMALCMTAAVQSKLGVLSIFTSLAVKTFKLKKYRRKPAVQT